LRRREKYGKKSTSGGRRKGRNDRRNDWTEFKRDLAKLKKMLKNARN
jgi:hypothetical protein